MNIHAVSAVCISANVQNRIVLFCHFKCPISLKKSQTWNKKSCVSALVTNLECRICKMVTENCSQVLYTLKEIYISVIIQVVIE